MVFRNKIFECVFLRWKQQRIQFKKKIRWKDPLLNTIFRLYFTRPSSFDKWFLSKDVLLHFNPSCSMGSRPMSFYSFSFLNRWPAGDRSQLMAFPQFWSYTKLITSAIVPDSFIEVRQVVPRAQGSLNLYTTSIIYENLSHRSNFHQTHYRSIAKPIPSDLASLAPEKVEGGRHNNLVGKQGRSHNP